VSSGCVLYLLSSHHNQIPDKDDSRQKDTDDTRQQNGNRAPMNVIRRLFLLSDVNVHRNQALFHFSLANGQTRPWEEKERCSGSYRLAVDMRFHLSFTSWAPIQRLIQTISQIRNKSLMVLSSFGIRSGAVFGIILLLFGRRRAFFLSSVNPWIKARRG